MLIEQEEEDEAKFVGFEVKEENAEMPVTQTYTPTSSPSALI